jgi:hypothetical protein
MLMFDIGWIEIPDRDKLDDRAIMDGQSRVPELLEALER